MVLEILGVAQRKAMRSQYLKNLAGAREVRMRPLDRTSHRRKSVDSPLEDVKNVFFHWESFRGRDSPRGAHRERRARAGRGKSLRAPEA